MKFSLACALFLVSSLASTAAAGDLHIEARHQVSYQGGGTTLTLWSDGHVEEVAVPGGPRTEAYHFSGRVPAKELADLVRALRKSGLAQESFKQRPVRPVMISGFVRLEVWNGKTLTSLQAPVGIGEPNKHTRDLGAKTERESKRLSAVVRRFLTRSGPAGVYAQAVALSARALLAKDVAPQAAPLRKALLRLGSYVFLSPEQAATLKHGQIMKVGGTRVAWVLRTLGTRKAPGEPEEDSKAGR